jgi:5-methylcytosine-specific restriction endonuclease McrA
MVDIEKLKTANGGYTKETLAMLGVPWPPPRGWAKKIKRGQWPLPEPHCEQVAASHRELQKHFQAKEDARKLARRQRRLERRKAARNPSPPPPKSCQPVLVTQASFVASKAFLATPEWKRVRYEALRRNDGRCECCGAGRREGVVLNVDHIKPRRKYPHLALDVDNTQVLCSSCNVGKGNRDQTNWKAKNDSRAAEVEADQMWQRFELF